MPDIEPAGPDPARMRISDEDRHRVAEVLRKAAGDGRIELGELDERLEAAFSAKTYADLVPITEDLPVAGETRTPVSSPAAPAGTGSRHVAILSGFERKGVWQVPAQMSVLAIMGGADLDLRRASFAAREVTITITAIMGGAHIVVGPGTHVVMDGTGIMGGFAGPSDAYADGVGGPGPDSPTVRVKGVAIMGGVHVERKGH